jgi:hypothetical protein
MPGVPIEMPSDTVMVPNVVLLPPAASAPFAAASASLSMCMLHGVRLLHVEAMPTCGFLKSRSTNPTARSIARLGVCLTPSNTSFEYGRGSTLRRLIERAPGVKKSRAIVRPAAAAVTPRSPPPAGDA